MRYFSKSSKVALPISIMDLTSSWVVELSSGSASIEVVPKIVTVPCGTKISASAGLCRRWMTLVLRRWLKAIKVPLDGLILMSMPAKPATRAHQGPAALIRYLQAISYLDFLNLSSTVMLSTAPFLVLIATTLV